MNVKLLKKVKAQIKKDWGHTNLATFSQETDCGTAYCIGGWAAYLAGNKDTSSIAYDARIALDISKEESIRLFCCTNWPFQFRGKISAYRPTKSQVLARIDHFIATEGRE